MDRKVILTLACAVGGALLFAGVAHDVSGRTGVATADPRILHDVIAYRSSALTLAAKTVTTFGTIPVAYSVVGIAGVFARPNRHGWWRLMLAAAVLVSGQLIRLGISRAVARPRPPHELWLMHAGGYAFPSGHTTTAALAYGTAAALLIQRWPGHRITSCSIAGLASVAVGLSRVYLGVHWPTDVLGGWLLAVSWLALCALAHHVFRLLRKRRGALAST